MALLLNLHLLQIIVSQR